MIKSFLLIKLKEKNTWNRKIPMNKHIESHITPMLEALNPVLCATDKGMV
jgi:hypothetical protein